jgi:hypothetical protein
MNGLPLFGLSNVSGNPASQGVYSLGGYDRNYPKVLNLEWLISTGNSSGVDIGAIEMVGTVLLVSWKDTTGSTTYGVDKIDLTAKVTSAYFATRIINVNRDTSKTLSGFVGYRSLPNNATIKVYYKVNHSTGAWVEATQVVDTIRNVVYCKETLRKQPQSKLKLKVTRPLGLMLIMRRK